MARLGFPIAEVHADGSSVITKHPGTGGLVSVGTVTAQLLYEIGAPAYLGPDAVADFATLRLTEVGPDRVRLSGTVGGAAAGDDEGLPEPRGRPAQQRHVPADRPRRRRQGRPGAGPARPGARRRRQPRRPAGAHRRRGPGEQRRGRLPAGGDGEGHRPRRGRPGLLLGLRGARAGLLPGADDDRPARRRRPPTASTGRRWCPRRRCRTSRCCPTGPGSTSRRPRRRLPRGRVVAGAARRRRTPPARTPPRPTWPSRSPGRPAGCRSAPSSAPAPATRAAPPTSASGPAPTPPTRWLARFLTVDRLVALLPEAAGLAVQRYELANLRALNFTAARAARRGRLVLHPAGPAGEGARRVAARAGRGRAGAPARLSPRPARPRRARPAPARPAEAGPLVDHLCHLTRHDTPTGHPRADARGGRGDRTGAGRGSAGAGDHDVAQADSAARTGESGSSASASRACSAQRRVSARAASIAGWARSSAERLGVQRVVGQVRGQQLDQPGVLRAGHLHGRRAPAASPRPRAGPCPGSCPRPRSRWRCRAGRRRAGTPSRTPRRSG